MRGQGVIIQSVDRAVQIIDLFTGRQAELGITEISEHMCLGKSTVYGLVNTLLKAGYLEQNEENKKYRLGLRLFELGSIVQSRIDVREISRPYLEELSKYFDMTVHMGIYRDWEMVYIDKVDGQHTRIVYSQVGKRAPMYCTGIGKAVLANMNRADVEYILKTQPMEALTEHTLTTPEAVSRELELTRDRGYAVDNEEVELGLRCVAVPVFDYRKKPVAAISISSAAAYLTEERIQEVMVKLRETAGNISKKMGYGIDTEK